MASCRRSSQSGLGRATVLTAAVAASALAAPPAGAEPHTPADEPASGHSAVDRLYEEAEAATDKYNAAEELTGELRGETDRLRDRVARGQERINRMRGLLGVLAGAQYRSGGLDPTISLLLSEDPESYLDKAATLERITSRQSGQLRALREAQRTLRQERVEATSKLAELARSRRVTARHKKIVEHKLARARRLLNDLPAGERAAYGRSSRDGADRVLSALDLPASSARAGAAFLAAQQAVGTPYAWGQAGPFAFDCSGLTQWAYQRAGVAIPRTSQQQRYAGRSVPLDQARPGDLVVYRSDASHVAMYAGNGQVIHAPHPGARVRYDPVGMMPIASITRV